MTDIPSYSLPFACLDFAIHYMLGLSSAVYTHLAGIGKRPESFQRMDSTMTTYTHHTESKKTKLTRLFFVQPHRRANKPGRELIVLLDDRYKLIPDFQTKYTYLVKFDEVGTSAGDHYHQKKSELYVPVVGSFTVLLEDIESHEKEIIDITVTDHAVLYIPCYIAHTVISNSQQGVLLVLANYANVEDDEYEYHISREVS